jgi:hypothetical protein
MVSTDCGATFTSVWKRGGTQLSTNPGTVASNWFPTAAQWTQSPIVVDITAYKNSPIVLQFRARNGFGQNIFLDNINIFGVIPTNYDAGVTAILSPIGEFCGSTTTPAVTVKNSGLLPLTSVRINSRVDNAALVSKDFSGLNIAPGASQNFTLDPINNLTNGSHTFTAYTTLPSGQADQFTSNDTARGVFTSNVAVALPIVEGFEGAAFPPAGWRVINPDGLATWIRGPVGRTGASSAGVPNYSYNAPGQLDYLRAPMVNFNNIYDSALVTFHYAYKFYGAANSDTLEVVISTDCGATWNSVWKRGGSELATTPGTGGAAFIPTATQWTTSPIRIELANYRNGNIFIAFRNKNGFGQNLFIDDINIFGVILPNFDATVRSIVSPSSDVCGPTFVPRVVVRNAGKITMTSVKVNYTIDNGSVVTTSFTGLNLPLSRDTILTLPVVNGLTPGNHTIKAYTTEPNGQVDQNPSNDTTSKTFSVKAILTNPLVEGFEGTFPPAGWEITQQPVDPTTWQKTTAAARSGAASAYINNYNYAANNRVDNLITPPIQYSGADSLFLKFDVSATTYSYPGSTATPLDTLEVLVTTDCGATYSSIYKKWGVDLQTIGDPNNVNTDEFFPRGTYQWRKDSINVTNLLGSANTVRFAFKNTTNFENNIFIDNVNFSPKVVGAKLKTNGFTITPSPFTSSFFVQHFRAPTDLRGLGVYNSIGQQVVSRTYNGQADSYMEVNMARLPAGVYTVKLIYTNRTVSQKVVKIQ